MPNVDDSKIKQAIKDFLHVPLEKLSDETRLTELVRESFILVEMVMYLQDEFNVQLVQDDLKTAHTVGELIRVFKEKSAS